jgi:hypothetical protein
MKWPKCMGCIKSSGSVEKCVYVHTLIHNSKKAETYKDGAGTPVQNALGEKQQVRRSSRRI